MSKNALYPASLMTLMAAYIALLAYRASNKDLPTPVYAFYDTTFVQINIAPAAELYDVYGIYNNILEGQRQIVKAEILPDSSYQLAFQVNSPRPAFVYINDEAIGVFLTPDSTLVMSVKMLLPAFRIDSIHFKGYTSKIAEYYHQKSLRFNNIHLRSSRNTIPIEDFCKYSQTLDSMAEQEITFLALYNLQTPLPDWFISFEQSEIAYHKAYLKLSGGSYSDDKSTCLDKVPLNNEDAIFSYYYYLYLKAYIKDHLMQTTSLALPADLNEPTIQLTVADTLLKGNIHDVFLTRTIFELIQRNRIDQASLLLEQYRASFKSKKYLRFLDYQLKQLKI